MAQKQQPTKERQLTPREEARLERFEQLYQRMEADGFTSKDLTFDLAGATGKMLLLPLPFVALSAAAYLLAHPLDVSILGSGSFATAYFFGALLTVALIVVHELIHGLTWGSFAKSGFASIDFGIIVSQLAPYCTCSEPLGRRSYIIGAAMPTVVIGVGLTVAAILTGSLMLELVCIVMIFGGGGDMLIIAMLARWQPTGREVLYCDHPTEVGLVVFER